MFRAALLLLVVLMAVLTVTWAAPDPAPVDENVVVSYATADNVAHGYVDENVVRGYVGENVVRGYGL